ncbi:hypothetical protein LOAG_11122 [Loa loa]|uniref:Uncharacterized protein n=1 Tax=Loa loa TaxID=7209 RepID=A0A1S0TP42_LOALO|nr:hypothetical protein LOAG_11122 [Loa loa]EFO17378.1 hypothetical protein LOAG_11122 [Loa loa]
MKQLWHFKFKNLKFAQYGFYCYQIDALEIINVDTKCLAFVSDMHSKPRKHGWYFRGTGVIYIVFNLASGSFDTRNLAEQYLEKTLLFLLVTVTITIAQDDETLYAVFGFMNKNVKRTLIYKQKLFWTYNVFNPSNRKGTLEWTTRAAS